MILISFQGNSQTENTILGDVLLSIEIDKVSIFVNKHYKGALNLWKSDSIPIAISLAQWGLESGWGRSRIALEKCNLGGIKLRSGEYRTFKNHEEFYKAYRDVLTKDCYKEKNLQELQEWIDALFHTECKYATSKNYKSKMWDIIFYFNLDLLG